MRKISKAVLYRPGDDTLHVRPRDVSGATITSWRERRDIDLAKLFSRPADPVSAAAASAPISSAGRKSANSRDDTPSTLAAAPDKSPTAVIV